MKPAPILAVCALVAFYALPSIVSGQVPGRFPPGGGRGSCDILDPAAPPSYSIWTENVPAFRVKALKNVRLHSH